MRWQCFPQIPWIFPSVSLALPSQILSTFFSLLPNVISLHFSLFLHLKYSFKARVFVFLCHFDLLSATDQAIPKWQKNISSLFIPVSVTAKAGSYSKYWKIKKRRLCSRGTPLPSQRVVNHSVCSSLGNNNILSLLCMLIFHGEHWKLDRSSLKQPL